MKNRQSSKDKFDENFTYLEKKIEKKIFFERHLFEVYLYLVNYFNKILFENLKNVSLRNFIFI